MYFSRNGVVIGGHYAANDFAAHGRRSGAPRSGFVQPLNMRVFVHFVRTNLCKST
jgi:hypothetical protein